MTFHFTECMVFKMIFTQTIKIGLNCQRFLSSELRDVFAQTLRDFAKMHFKVGCQRGSADGKP